MTITLPFVRSLYPEYVRRVAPVVADDFKWVVNPDLVTAIDGWKTVEFSVTKLRECKYTGLRLYWKGEQDGYLQRMPWDQARRHGPTAGSQTRSPGKLRVAIKIQSHLPVARWRMEVSHSCDPSFPEIVTRLWP